MSDNAMDPKNWPVGEKSSLRQRIAELTRQRDIEAGEGDKLRGRIAELERELATANSQDRLRGDPEFGFGIKTHCQKELERLERENAELKADRHRVGLIETLRERNQIQQELIAIQTGLKNEWKDGGESGDTVADFATFLEHHSAVEKERDVLRLNIARLRWAMSELLICEPGVNCISAGDHAKETLASTPRPIRQRGAGAGAQSDDWRMGRTLPFKCATRSN